MEKEESYSYESDWNQREDVELDMSTYDSGYVERWDDDGYSSSDFENEPDGVFPNRSHQTTTSPSTTSRNQLSLVRRGYTKRRRFMART